MCIIYTHIFICNIFLTKKRCTWKSSKQLTPRYNFNRIHPTVLALSPLWGPSWPLGLTELTVAAESSASGLMSSTLWSTARRAQRDWGEVVTRRWAWEAGKLCLGLKFKPTCGIGDKVRRTNFLIDPWIHQPFLGVPQIWCKITLTLLMFDTTWVLRLLIPYLSFWYSSVELL